MRRPASWEGRQALLDKLKAEVRRLEGESSHSLTAPFWRSSPTHGTEVSSPAQERQSHSILGRLAEASVQPFPPRQELERAATDGWTLGEATFDSVLPGGCLDPNALIELKPDHHGDWPAAMAFAACLAIRRLDVGKPDSGASPTRPVLWCTTQSFVAEHGRLHGPGLVDLGLSPDTLILAEAAREVDALWALEEGLRCGALSLAVGLLKGVGLTASRRLGLAAAQGRTPALLLTLPASAPAPSAALRLRLRRLPSPPHPLDQRAPGAPPIRLMLERCRRAPAAVETVALNLEWCDVTYRFRLASGVVDRALAARDAWERARS